MNINKRFHLNYFLVIIGLGFNSIYASQDIVLDAEKIEISKISGETMQSKSGVHVNLHLILAKDYFQISEDGLEYIYDFSHRKVIILDPKNKIYEEFSIFTYIGFRTAEMENRLRVYDNFKKYNDKQFLSYLTPLMLENYFSIKSSRDSEKINVKSSEGKITYIADGIEGLMETSKEGKLISKEDMNIFSKFMRYRVGGHPDILSKINEASTVPDWFSNNSTTDGRHFIKTNYKLVSLKNLSDVSYSLDGYKPGTIKFSGDFLGFIKSSTREFAKDSEQKISTIETEIKESINQKKYFEAILGCMEIGLYSSRFDNAVCKENLKVFQTDEKVLVFLSNLNSDEKNMLNVSYQKLKELEPASFKKTYILWVFEANLKARSGETQEAFDLYYKALKKNPYLTGVYKDMGEIFYSNYNMDMAWFCWDTGRKIFKDHSMLKEIDKLEEDMVKKYPDFF
ncbi:MAG: hypothetical protein OEV78_04710 [Spirochaetia bacterium]|nr:hypothetical protein [Spirochaetia bacterium]